MTDQERSELEIRRAYAKRQCSKCWKTIEELERMIKRFKATHTRYHEEFKRADRALANEDRLKVIPEKKKKEKKQLEKDPDLKLLAGMGRTKIRKIAERLGVEV